jgi:hypothetical protein
MNEGAAEREAEMSGSVFRSERLTRLALGLCCRCGLRPRLARKSRCGLCIRINVRRKGR